MLNSLDLDPADETLGLARGYKTFSCFTQLSSKFILLINVKMSTFVGILIFIGIINTTKQETFLFDDILVFMSRYNFVRI